MPQYLLGRGCVFIGALDANGNPTALTEFHNTSFELDSKTEEATHKNTCDAVAVTDLKVITGIMPELKITFDSAHKAALALILGGNITDRATPGTFLAANTVFPSGVAVGETYAIPNGWSNLASLTITDSAGTPATLTAGTHYTVDLAKGTVTFLNLGTFTQPFKAAGSQHATDFNEFSIAEVGGVYRFIRFAGKNLGDSNKTLNADFYNVFVPPTKINLKTEGNDFEKFELNCTPMKGTAAQIALGFGPYGKIVQGG